MFRQSTLAAVALGLCSAAIVPAAPAAAQSRYDRYEQRYDNGRYQDSRSGYGYEDRRSYGYDDRRYDDRSQGDYRRYKKCKREGTAGTIIGAIAGGLLGRSLRGDNATGTILGAGAGALAGRAIDRGDRPEYCR